MTVNSVKIYIHCRTFEGEKKGFKMATEKLRRQQDLNLRGQSPADFESASLTTRTYRRVTGKRTNLTHLNLLSLLLTQLCLILPGQQFVHQYIENKIGQNLTMR